MKWRVDRRDLLVVGNGMIWTPTDEDFFTAGLHR